MEHVAWTDIENFYSLRRSLVKYPTLLNNNSKVSYKAKVKLHGTCVAVGIDFLGGVTPMSRSTVLSLKNDNAGFARWCAERESMFSALKPKEGSLVIYGEWCGPGVQKGVAVNQLKERSFMAFAARYISERGERFVIEPTELQVLVEKMGSAYVIPWFNSGELFEIDWSEAAEQLQPVVDRINAHVDHVEQCDPLMSSMFGVRGVGEGLVFYPVSAEHKDYSGFSNLCFKAKGEKHQVVAHTKPAQVDATVAANAVAFAEMVVTPARLEQGVRATSGGELRFDPKNISAFITWIANDLAKETQAELEASGLDVKVAQKACLDRARTWFVAEMKKL